MEVIRDVVYAERPQRTLLADLYIPDEAVSLRSLNGQAGLRPAIVWLHGGGWRFGNRRQSPPLERYYAQRGYVMVSIDYRRSHEALFPAAVEDVKTAVRWLQTNAGRYHIDPKRVGLWGSSAGGHLAALAALSGPDQFCGDELSSAGGVAAVVDAYGPSDFLQMDAHRDPGGKPSDDIESIQLPPGKKTADADSLESLFLGAPVETCPELVRRANPVSYVHPGAPPFLLLHGMSDTAVPVHQSILLYSALVQAGNAVTLGLVHKLGHGFLNRAELDDKERQLELYRGKALDEATASIEPARIFELVGDWFDLHL